MFYILFKTTNLANGKVYHGVHFTNDLFFGTPQSNDDFFGASATLRKDTQLYGRAAFRVEAIHAFTDAETANKALRHTLKNAPPNSYNTDVFNRMSEISKGKQHVLGHVHSEETKERLSELHSGTKNPFYGGKHDSETLQQLSSFRTTMMWINNGLLEKQQPKADPIPDGWAKGRIKSRKAALSQANKS